MDRDQLHRLLPHQGEALWLDRLIEHDPERIVGLTAWHHLAALLDGALPGGALLHGIQPRRRSGHILQAATRLQRQQRKTHLDIGNAEALAREPGLSGQMLLDHLTMRHQLLIKPGLLHALAQRRARRTQQPGHRRLAEAAKDQLHHQQRHQRPFGVVQPVVRLQTRLLVERG